MMNIFTEFFSDVGSLVALAIAVVIVAVFFVLLKNSGTTTSQYNSESDKNSFLGNKASREKNRESSLIASRLNRPYALEADLGDVMRTGLEKVSQERLRIGVSDDDVRDR